MTNLRKMMIAAAATGLLASQALAAEVSLPAGKPAGVKEAQGSPNALTALGVGVAIAGAIGIALAVDDSNGACGAACNPPVATTGTGAP